jgi:hypothetical protein
MVDESRAGGMFEARPWEDRGGVAAGTILATALAAGTIAFLLRRAREDEAPVGRVARFARTWVDTDSMEAGRDFFIAKVLPELKPAMLAILEEVQDVVDQAFRRTEKAIKKL